MLSSLDIHCHSGCGFILVWTLAYKQCAMNLAMIFWGRSEPELHPLLSDKQPGQMLITNRSCVSEVCFWTDAELRCSITGLRVINNQPRATGVTKITLKVYSLHCSSPVELSRFCINWDVPRWVSWIKGSSSSFIILNIYETVFFLLFI